MMRLVLTLSRGRSRRRYGLTGFALAVGVAVGSLALCDAGLAQDAPKETPLWQRSLGLQLKNEYNCDLDKVLFDREFDAGGHATKEGRARCFDGREFDFTRDAKHEKFELRLCQPTVC